MTALTINDTVNASTSDINDIVRRMMADNFDALNYKVQFDNIGVGELDTTRVHRFVSIGVEGSFANKSTERDLNTWYDFKAEIAVIFETADDTQPTGSFSQARVENYYGFSMIASPGDTVKYWPLEDQTAGTALFNLVRYLIAKAEGRFDDKETVLDPRVDGRPNVEKVSDV